ncbi:MAG: hypothetical protein UX48_C0021G0001, partial [Candidatus Azambacteria bacterium GW2011_GWB1_46_27]
MSQNMAIIGAIITIHLTHFSFFDPILAKQVIRPETKNKKVIPLKWIWETLT